MKLNRPLVLYPGLLIVLFILTKIQLNKVNPEFSHILIFSIINIASVILIFVVLNYFIKDRTKAWLVDFTLFAYILFYYKIKAPLSNISFIESFLNSFTKYGGAVIIIFLFIVTIGISVLIIRYKSSLVHIGQFFNFLLSFLIAYQVYTIATQDTRKIGLENRPGNFDLIQKRDSDKLPDIYYIILDAYTNSQSLKDYWNFDNGEFMDFLANKGFVIAKKSRSNYNLTLYSLASSLNMSYIKNIAHSTATKAQEENLFNLIDSSYVVRTLLKNDYKVVNYSFFDIPDNPKYYNDFYFLVKNDLLEGTIYGLVLEMFKNKSNSAKDQNFGIYSLRAINPGILNKLQEQHKDRGNKPLFVYAHIMMPHDPYFFDENGQIMDGPSVLDPKSKERYLAQLKYLNKLVENTLNKIFENNHDKMPVIIIQGDHGYRYLNNKNQLNESSTIFNAYFFPDHDYSKIYSSISPVNSFRTIFNKYFDYKLAILRDTTFNVSVY